MGPREPLQGDSQREGQMSSCGWGLIRKRRSSFSERRESRVTLGTPVVQSQENGPSRSPFPKDPQAPGRGPWSFTRMKSLDRPIGTQ